MKGEPAQERIAAVAEARGDLAPGRRHADRQLPGMAPHGVEAAECLVEIVERGFKGIQGSIGRTNGPPTALSS
jgi:NADH dehydrogenase FAD-containing subunit